MSAIDKTCFEIYDPVGVYEALDSVNTMKPVVVNPNISIGDIINKIKEDNGIYTADELKYKQNQLEQLVGKLNRKQQSMSDKKKKDFKTMTGKSTTDFIDELRALPVEKLALIYKSMKAILLFYKKKMLVMARLALFMRVKMK